MQQYLLLLRDEPGTFIRYSPEEMREIMQRYRDWRAALPGQITGGHKLKDGEGRTLRKNAGQPAVTDGPFVESKEVLAGFFIVEADSYEQAVKLAKTCPHLDYGSIEVRAVERT